MIRSCGPRFKGVNRANEEDAGDRVDLLGISLEYMGLQLRLRSLMEHQRRVWPGTAWTEELEEQWSRKLDPIRDRMVELRWKAVNLPATDLRELKAKATILLEVTDTDPNNVCAQLALSLCQDLLQFSEAAILSGWDQDLDRHSSSRSEAGAVD